MLTKRCAIGMTGNNLYMPTLYKKIFNDMAKELKWHKAKKNINSRSPLDDILVLYQYPVDSERIRLAGHVEVGQYYISLDELKQLPKEE